MRRIVTFFSANSHIFANTRLSFWHFSIAGWGVFWCGDVLFILMQKIPAGEILAQALDAPLGLLLSLVLRQIYRHLEYKNISILALFALMFYWSTVFSVVWHVPMIFTRYVFVGPETLMPLLNVKNAVQWFSRTMPIWFGWSTLFFVISYWKDWEREHARAREAQALAQHAQLQMLRYQVHPHFLFNALNSVRALIDEDKNSARVMITELTEFLRYSLANREQLMVPLSAELEAMSYYLGIEKKRFEDKLDVCYCVDEKANGFPVLSFLLHPLVENAVKHGMKTSVLPLRIRIETVRTGDGVDILVSNSGRWRDEGTVKGMSTNGTGSTKGMFEKNFADGTGTGLENVRARLTNSFPLRHSVEIQKKDGWVVVHIHIRGAA